MNRWNSSASCEQVFDIVPFHQCDFVRSVLDCQNNNSFVDYLEILYCTPNEAPASPKPAVLVGLLLCMLFFLLGSAAGEFLCPNLVNISRALKMSQSMAGVTLLAFGNGAPDVVSTLAGVSQNRSSLVIAELYGGAMYICTVVIGLLFIFNDFDVPLSLLRDVLFYLVASCWALYLFKRGHVELQDALGFLVLYVIYLLCATVVPKLFVCLKRTKFFKKITSRERISSDDGYSSEERLDQFIYQPIQVTSPSHRPARLQRKFSSSISLHRHLENAICSLTTTAGHEIQERTPRSQRGRHSSICECNMRLSRCPSRAQFSIGNSGAYETTPLLSSGSTRALPTGYIFPHKYSEWQEFIMRFWPVGPKEWRETSTLKKIFHLITYPLLLPLLLTIPLEDEHIRRNNWSRPLSVFQCIIFPVVTLFLTKQLDLIVHGLPIWTVGLMIGFIAGISVFFTSIDREAPKYHVFFSFVGFLVSLAWIFRLATEVVSILRAFGIYFHISEESLGVSILTWGNYLGDLVTNLSVASQGYPQMALSACLSTSLVAILLGFGSAFTSRFLMTSKAEIQVHSSDMQDVIYISLLVSMIILVSGTSIAKFRSSRILGFLLIAYYLVFFLVIVLKECGVVELSVPSNLWPKN